MTEAARPPGAEERTPDPCLIVIFGASGDLTQRKLVPALFTLFVTGAMPKAFGIVGYSRKTLSDAEFRAQLKAGCDEHARIKPTAETWARFESTLSYVEGAYDAPGDYATLEQKLNALDQRLGTQGNRVFYLSTPPSAFPVIVKALGAAKLVGAPTAAPFRRVIIEKPFGTDLSSAQTLNREVLSVLDERSVYRIDHYLGKETVQNLMVLRFANGFFEPLWNNRYVESVQITGAERIGIEGRGGYFEQAGIVRDMVQNHLFQVLALTAMEPPVTLGADDLRDEKVKVLKALRPIPPERVEELTVRGQYTAGHGQVGYREEKGVSPDSHTETYVALTLFIDNWRWAGVPFHLRSAKAMPKKVTEVALVFREPPLRLFGRKVAATQGPNVLAIRIQPEEGISLRFGVKVPGNAMDIRPVDMDFRYGTTFGAEPPEAYERLLLDCMLGDQALFTRGDEVEASWKWISRLHRLWAEHHVAPHPYQAGTWGPAAAEEMVARSGHSWRTP